MQMDNLYFSLKNVKNCKDIKNYLKRNLKYNEKILLIDSILRNNCVNTYKKVFFEFAEELKIKDLLASIIENIHNFKIPINTYLKLLKLISIEEKDFLAIFLPFFLPKNSGKKFLKKAVNLFLSPIFTGLVTKYLYMNNWLTDEEILKNRFLSNTRIEEDVYRFIAVKSNINFDENLLTNKFKPTTLEFISIMYPLYNKMLESVLVSNNLLAKLLLIVNFIIFGTDFNFYEFMLREENYLVFTMYWNLFLEKIDLKFLEDLYYRWDELDKFKQASIVKKVGDIKAKEALNLVILGLRSKDGRVKSNAIEGLIKLVRSNFIDKKTAVELINKIDSKHHRFKQMKAYFYWLMGIPKGLVFVKEMLEKGDSIEKKAAIFCLKQMDW